MCQLVHKTFEEVLCVLRTFEIAAGLAPGLAVQNEGNLIFKRTCHEFVCSLY